MQKPNDRYALHFLVGILVLRIASYFMWSDNLAITQGIKAGLRLGLTVITGTGLLILIRHRNAYGIRFPQMAGVALYCLYLILGAASFLWTSSLENSLQQWIMDLEGFVFAFLYIGLLLQYRHRNPQYDLSIPRLFAPAVLLTGLLFEAGLWLQPELYYRYTHGGAVARLGGFIINPNELGMLLVTGIAAMLFRMHKEGRYRISVILSMLFLTRLLILTGSRSSMIALMLVMVVYALSSGNKRLRLGIGFGALLLIPVAGFSFFVKQGDWTELVTFTGRLPFWHDLLTFNFPREPWLGYGYMRIDYADKFESLNAYAGAMTHNTFLQVLLGLGLTGLLLVLLQLLAFFRSLHLCTDARFSMQSLILFIPLLVNSLTEFGIFGETNYGILFYLLLVFSAAAEPAKEFRRITGINQNESPNHLSGRYPAAA